MGMRNEPFHLAYQLDRGGFDRRYDQFDGSGNSNYKSKNNALKEEEEDDACCGCCCSLKMSCLVIGWLKIVVVLMSVSLIIVSALIDKKERVKEPLFLTFYEIAKIALLAWDLIVDIILLVGVYQKKISHLNIFVGINGAFLILGSFFVLKSVFFKGPPQVLFLIALGMTFLLISLLIVQCYIRQIRKRSREDQQQQQPPPAHIPYEFTA